MKTGFKELDNITLIRPGELIIVGSRPAVGKSCFVRQIALNMAEDNNKNISIIDLCNSEQESRMMALCQIGEVNRRMIGPISKSKNMNLLDVIVSNQENGTSSLDGMGFQRIVGAQTEQCYKNLNWKNLEIGKEFQQLLEEDKWPDVLVIDSIQMLCTSLESWFEISQTLKKLKRRAVEENTIVICTSDISRKVDQRTGHRPILTDLSDSSALEEIADKVIFILRKDYYDPHDKPGHAEIILSKDKIGGCGDVWLKWEKEVAKFKDFEHESSEYLNEEAFAVFLPNS